MADQYRVSVSRGRHIYFVGYESDRIKAEALAEGERKRIIPIWEGQATRHERRCPPPEIAVWKKVTSYKPKVKVEGQQ